MECSEIAEQQALAEGETQRVNPRVLKWHSTSTDLGMYYYRARWYLPQVVTFAELGLFEFIDSPDLCQFVADKPTNTGDPNGSLNQGAHLKKAVRDLMRDFGLVK